MCLATLKQKDERCSVSLSKSTPVPDSLRFNGVNFVLFCVREEKWLPTSGCVWLAPPEARVVRDVLKCARKTFSKVMKKSNPISSEEVSKGFLGFKLVIEFLVRSKSGLSQVEVQTQSTQNLRDTWQQGG